MNATKALMARMAEDTEFHELVDAAKQAIDRNSPNDSRLRSRCLQLYIAGLSHTRGYSENASSTHQAHRGH